MFKFFSKHKMVDAREATFKWNGRTARTVAYYTAAQGFCFDIESLEGGTSHPVHSKRRQKVGTSDELWTAAVQQLRMIWGMGPSDDFCPDEPLPAAGLPPRVRSEEVHPDGPPLQSWTVARD
jgi:hypothetical protein